jgi:hypothetical protein
VLFGKYVTTPRDKLLNTGVKKNLALIKQQKLVAFLGVELNRTLRKS